MSTPYIRKATEYDAFIMEQIMRDAFTDSYAHFMPEQYVREFYDNNEAERVVRMGIGNAAVAEVMGRIVGFTITQDSIIEELWVEPAYQGKGVGKALIQWVEDDFRKKGQPTMTLYCYEVNTKAFEFYKNIRFRRTSTFQSKDVAGGPINVYTMTRMVKKLKG